MAQADDLPGSWGRWGEDDEAGTLNLITRRGPGEGRRGGPHRPGGVPGDAGHAGADRHGSFRPDTKEVSPVQRLMALTQRAGQASADVMVVANHAVWTHLDALSHQAIDGLVYPGRPLDDSATPAGVTHGSTTAFAAGVITRGVLLDLAADGPLPGGPVTGRDLDAAGERQGVTVEPGDVRLDQTI
jgi:hypothetical protein